MLYIHTDTHIICTCMYKAYTSFKYICTYTKIIENIRKSKCVKDENRERDEKATKLIAV